MKAIYALVGMRFRGTEALVKSMQSGDPVTLVREPNNEHDKNAVAVHAHQTVLGYVPKTQNKDLARKLDQRDGKAFGKFVAGQQPMVEIEE